MDIKHAFVGVVVLAAGAAVSAAELSLNGSWRFRFEQNKSIAEVG